MHYVIANKYRKQLKEMDNAVRSELRELRKKDHEDMLTERDSDMYNGLDQVHRTLDDACFHIYRGGNKVVYSIADTSKFEIRDNLKDMRFDYA